MRSDEVQEERNRLRSLLVSNYAEFKAVVFGDMLQVMPPQSSPTGLIEDYLKSKYGEAYVPEQA